MSNPPKPGSGYAATDKTPSSESPVAAASVNLMVNGRVRTISLEPRITLLDALREKLTLTDTKKARDRGQCGAWGDTGLASDQPDTLRNRTSDQDSALHSATGRSAADLLSPNAKT
jgi:xanthine dehydrogenase YagT iron-sulfur-binding subunit